MTATMMTRPSDAHTAFGFESKKDLETATVAFDSNLSGDDCHFVTTLPDGRIAKWSDFDPTDAQVNFHSTWNDAARSIIAGSTLMYRDFHGVEKEAVDVCEIEDADGRIIGFRLSLDVDGRQRGRDEKFGSF